MIEFIDTWMSESGSNLNVFIAVTLTVFAVSTLLIIIFNKKLGETDERKRLIQLKVNQGMYITLLAFLFFMIATVGGSLDHTKQFLLFGISLSLFAGACLCIYHYYKERV
ncbi:hypothetical protein EQV77_06870 [Halobacillus fulvus]|nr:hypothetical protein EQV77_06870 [Halobacillus fulvus]